MNTPIVKARVHTGIANTIDRACDNADNGLHTTAIRILAAGLGDLSRLLCKLAPDLDITSGGEVVEECQTCEGALFIEAIRAEPSSCGTTLVRLPCPECNAQPAPVATPTSTPPPAPEVEAIRERQARTHADWLDAEWLKDCPDAMLHSARDAHVLLQLFDAATQRAEAAERERDEAREKLEGANKTPDGALIVAANAMQAAFLKTLYEIIPDTAAGERDERWDVIQAYTDALKRIGTEEYRAARMATTTPPAAPCEMCGGRGEVAGHEPDGSWDTRPCPDCAPPAAPSEPISVSEMDALASDLTIIAGSHFDEADDCDGTCKARVLRAAAALQQAAALPSTQPTVAAPSELARELQEAAHALDAVKSLEVDASTVVETCGTAAAICHRAASALSASADNVELVEALRAIVADICGRGETGARLSMSQQRTLREAASALSTPGSEAPMVAALRERVRELKYALRDVFSEAREHIPEDLAKDARAQIDFDESTLTPLPASPATQESK